VENNGYSMGTSIERGTSMSHRIIAKGEGCGLTGYEIEGMDVLTVYEEMKKVADTARAESRPAMVDLRTYRFKGHSMSDPRKYRTRDEEQEWEAGDPITRLRDAMIEGGLIDEEGFKALNKVQKTVVREAINWAEQSPEPDISELYTDVYVEKFGPYIGTSKPQIVTDAEESS
jgi:pyruvate dehydrogenase E1 component alpha subunit